MRTVTQPEAKPSARVLAFPPSRMVGRARRLARLCLMATAMQEETLMRREMERIHRALDLAGVSEAYRDREIEKFIAVSDVHFASLADRKEASV